MNNNLLLQGLEQIGFSQQKIQASIDKLEMYARELQQGNDEYGLTAIVDYDEIIVRHILDSLVAVPHLYKLIKDTQEARKKTGSEAQGQLTIADIGSGGGIPGIPLSIMMDDINFVLAERMTKRCKFLNYCKQKLSLDNITVETIEAERIEQKRFDIIVFRAFRPLEKKMTRVLLRVLKEDGTLVAYKAKKEKINEEMLSIKQWIPEFETIPLEVPFLDGHERHLVVVKKL